MGLPHSRSEPGCIARFRACIGTCQGSGTVGGVEAATVLKSRPHRRS
jgi:hypothetical protein